MGGFGGSGRGGGGGVIFWAPKNKGGGGGETPRFFFFGGGLLVLVLGFSAFLTEKIIPPFCPGEGGDFCVLMGGGPDYSFFFFWGAGGVGRGGIHRLVCGFSPQTRPDESGTRTFGW